MRRGDNPIRRSQLIMTYGPGSLVITPRGETVMVAGLDYWFQPWPHEDQRVDADEYTFHDGRLERRLGVTELRLAPDYQSAPNRRDRANYKLPVPVLRFPRWCACPVGGNLRCFSPTEVWGGRGNDHEPECTHEWSGPGRRASKRRSARYVAVPLLAVCDAGHVQDFPFRQWAHRDPLPSCTKRMRLNNLGGAIEQQRVACECGVERDLRGVLEFSLDQEPATSFLSDTLATGQDPYRCRGLKAWVGAVQERCTRPLVGILSSATNLYYPDVRSSLYIPPDTNRDPQLRPDLIDALSHPSLSATLGIVHENADETTIGNLTGMAGVVDADITDVRRAIAFVRKERDLTERAAQAEQEYDERDFRLEEYRRLATNDEFRTEFLHIVPQDPGPLARLFSRVALVHRLRESRALVGFSRLQPPDTKELRSKKRLLWKDLPRLGQWLPGCFVHGEGVFLELHPDRVRELECVSSRPQPTGFRPRVWDPSATFVALHTLAHLLIRRLSFTCGYSAASIRERLYVLSSGPSQMHGLLIYTASGDSEGSMGGLVRASRVKSLARLLEGVLEDARWCAGDPVCRESGETTASAACHACCFLPETSCECANTSLNRGFLVSDSKASDGLLIRGLPTAERA